MLSSSSDASRTYFVSLHDFVRFSMVAETSEVILSGHINIARYSFKLRIAFSVLPQTSYSKAFAIFLFAASENSKWMFGKVLRSDWMCFPRLLMCYFLLSPCVFDNQTHQDDRNSLHHNKHRHQTRITHHIRCQTSWAYALRSSVRSFPPLRSLYCANIG
jgi:hypothetical protein